MSNPNLDFSYDMKGVDRTALLMEAANQLDALQGFLGGEEAGKGETAVGTLTRSFTEDHARFGDLPNMYKITDEYYVSLGLKVPYSFTQLTQNCNFYWLDLPLNLYPKHNWAFRRLEVAIEFNPHATKDGTRPKSYQILPDQKFQTLVELHGNFEVKLDANFEFNVSTGSIPVTMGPVQGNLEAGAGAKVGGGMGLVIPPYVYSIKQAKIEHSDTGIEEVRWLIDGPEFFQENKPRLTVIIQVLKGAKELKIAAAMQAYRYFKFARADLQEAVKELPRKIKEFFVKGLPIRDETPDDKPWDMTHLL